MGIRRFCRSEDGYVMVLALIAMPLMLGFALLVIDVGRGNNLHTDLQNAADALALAGARELDGADDAITRSNAVIAGLLNNQARFGDSGAAIIDEDEVTITYLTDIPASDDDPIDAAWIADNGTADATQANYVMVRTDPRPITSIWPVPVSWTNSTVNMQAEAVATYVAAACDITPLFMCNPFEGMGKSVHQAYQDGDFHGAMISLHLGSQGDPAGPGNYGFLAIGGQAGANALKEYFAGNGAPLCIEDTQEVETEPGDKDVIERAINTRFDMNEPGAIPGNFTPGPPAVNVRKGIRTSHGSDKPGQCNPTPVLSINPTLDRSMAFPDDETLLVDTAAGARVGGGDFDRDLYWQTNYGTTLPEGVTSSFPDMEPSRYDIYQYEIANNLHRTASPGGENGEAMCYQNANGDNDPPSDPDRRIIFAALVDCIEEGAINGRKDLTVAAFAKVFLVRPVRTQQNTPRATGASGEIPFQLGAIDIEVDDITGPGGRGTLDQLLREESVLVR